MKKRPGSTTMPVAYADVQAHYDISNDFFGLFQDATRTYSCALLGCSDFFRRNVSYVGQFTLVKGE